MQHIQLAGLTIGLASVACGPVSQPTAALPRAIVTSVAVSLDAPGIKVGSRAAAHAVAVDQYGKVVAPSRVRWSVGGGDILAIDSNGTLIAKATGRTYVSAAVDSVVGSTPVDVGPADEEQGSPRRPALPRVILDFPFPTRTGRSIVVGPNGNLQSALNSARRGDEVVLAAGATYSGNFTLPEKNGTAADGWITVRTDKLAALPPVGTRVTAAQAALMPRIMTTNTAPALRTAPGASGWRLVGLEVTASPAITEQQYGLVFLGESGGEQKTMTSVPSDLVLDRMYIHGHLTTNLSRCVALNSARTQVSDSYIVECHGRGFDSQAIAGWNGPGPYRIVNNTLQGAGENLMFGGSDPGIPGLVPSDIEIRGNHLYTPAAWKGVWSKKNLFELKNAARVLMEGNVLDGSWLDGQTGWAIVLKSGNQSGGCRWCRTTDVTIRRNLIRNAGAGISVAAKDDNPNTDTTARRIMVSETVIVDIGKAPFAGDARGFMLLGGTSDVTIERTILTGNLQSALVLDPAGGGTKHAVFRDNVWAFGQYGAIASGSGPGTASLRAAAPDAVWERMNFIGPARTGFPVGTGFVSQESHVRLSSRIRAAVDSATAGVVIP